jgi:hypothetical protein
MGDSSGNGCDSTTRKSIGEQHIRSTDYNVSGLNAGLSRTKPDECTSAHTNASVQTFQTSMAPPISAHIAATLTESSPLAQFKLPCSVESPAPSRMVPRFTPSPMVPACTPSPMFAAFTPSPMVPAFTPSPMVIIPTDVEARRRESPVRSNLSEEKDMNLEACILADCILADVDADDEEDSEDDQFEAHCGECPSEAEQSDEEHGLKKEQKSTKKSEVERAKLHHKQAGCAFEGFKCGCAAARLANQDSCLDLQFKKSELRTIHEETYGRSVESVKISQVLTHIHQLYWSCATPMEQVDAIGRTHKIENLKLLGKVVCAAAFRCAVGGSRAGHRQRKALVLRGFSPQSMHFETEAKLALKTLEARHGREQQRTAFARNWWHNELSLHDWLPNEHAIQFKGPFWEVLHKQCYKPVATAQSGLPPLSYKPWKSQMLPGARQLASTFADCSNPECIRVRRSARHSHFPECVDCQRRRAAYLQVMSAPGSSAASRDEALQSLQEHMSEWQTDRSIALKLKDHSSGKQRESCYECDDKCGSQWVELPVAEGGRDNKTTATLKFKFGLQCNVIVGGGGVNRFMVVPKHIKTGSNFGLTCLLLAIWRAKEMGRLDGQAGQCFYRHTDGGPDNLSIATHILHWLLVWLGVFQELIWFRFDSGHSHTELADRFFAMLKRLFATTRGAERAQRLDDFKHLEEEMHKTFKGSAEGVELEYLFANWDLNQWFEFCHFQIDKDFGNISFDNVFRYTYDETCWNNGCVKVTYKRRLAWTGGSKGKDCEWSPFVQVTTQSGERNVTTEAGVVFVTHPPGALKEPQREDYSQTPCEAAAVIRKLVDKRDGQPEELSANAKAHWAALESVYKLGHRPGMLPEMPTTVQGFTFSGSPRQLLPILKGLRRFARPMLYWDPFEDEAPAEWPDPASVELRAAMGEPGSAQEPTETSGVCDNLRDPRVSNTVTGAHWRKNQSDKESQQVCDEEWAKTFASKVPVKRIIEGELYLVQLLVAEGGFRLGFAEAGKPQGHSQHEAKWFVKSSVGPWNDTPTFKPYEKGGKRETDAIDCGAFLMELDDGWLTDASQSVKHTSLRLKLDFVRKIRILASLYPYEYGANIKDAEDGQVHTEQPVQQAGAQPMPHQEHPAPQPPQPPAQLRATAQTDRVGAPHLTEAAHTIQEGALHQPMVGLQHPAKRHLSEIQPQECGQDKLKTLLSKVAPGARIVSVTGDELANQNDMLSAVMQLIDDNMNTVLSRGDIRSKKAILVHPKVQSVISFRQAHNGQLQVLGFVSFQAECPVRSSRTKAGEMTGGYIEELHVVGKKELNLRRKRLGSMLLQYAELAIAHTGASRVWLTVQEATGATEFYTKMHYTCRRQCVKPGEQLWSKQLTL